MAKIIDTGLLPIWSQGNASPLFIPMTGAINTAGVSSARVAYNIESDSGNGSYNVAYQMSNDGETWSATVTGLGSSSTTTGWNYQESAASSIATDQRLFVRFGIEMKNSSGTNINTALGQIRLELTETQGFTAVSGPTKVFSDGSASSGLFHALTGAIPYEAISSVRASLELQADSGDAIAKAGYQVSNDGENWFSGDASASEGTWTTFGSARNGDGRTYGTTFSSFAPSEKKQWVRFGVDCYNGTAGAAQSCLATLRVDYRA